MPQVRVEKMKDEVLQLREERDVPYSQARMLDFLYRWTLRLTAENGVISEHIHTLQKDAAVQVTPSVNVESPECLPPGKQPFAHKWPAADLQLANACSKPR